MTADRLLEHFDRVSEASGAVPRLRQFILNLAVRGKLVEQDAKDEPASLMVRRILADTQSVSPQRSRSDMSAEEIEIPASWAWISLGDAAHIEMGQSPSSDHYNQSGRGMPFYQGKADFGVRHPTPRWWCTSPSKIAKKGDVLISVRAPVGPTNITTENCCIGRGLAALRPREGIALEFLLLSLQAFGPALAALGFGTTFEAINKRHLTTFAIPLAPLSEQGRIVAKVEELMALCDRLEATQADRETRRDRVVAASLQRLTEPAEAEQNLNDVRFHVDYLPRITSRAKDVTELRQTFSNMALRGLLSRQEQSDEPALQLLQRIQAERGRLLANGLLRQGKRDAPPTDVISVPFAIPTSWSWAMLSQIALGFRYGTSVKCAYKGDGVPVLRIPNVAKGRIHLDDLKYGRLSAREAADLRLELGDILLVRSNGSLDLVGRPAEVEASAVGFCYAGYLVRARTNPQLMNTRYLILALSSRHVRDQIEIPIRSSVGLKNVNATELGRLTVPVPPFAEQHRIVGKVDELMTVCDRVEAHIAAGETTRSRLLEALLHEALTGASAGA